MTNCKVIPRLLAVLALLAADASSAAEMGPFGLEAVPCEDKSGRSFQLSMDYPKEKPEEELVPWKGIDPKTDPTGYLRAVREYIYQGNLAVHWQVEKNPVRRWYHVPWLHLTNRGRECLRGMTRERDSRPLELDEEKQKSRFQNWGIAMYNPPGGYTIGQVWQTGLPDLTKARFPVGTVAVKLLFTEATVDQVSYLEDAVEWRAMIHAPGLNVKNEREEKTLRLLQMDVAVRDDRVEEDGTGWVFGTFVYRKGVPGSDPWQNMLPVGLMWGNDPGVMPRDVERARRLAEKKKKEEEASASLPQAQQSVEEADLLQQTEITKELKSAHFLGWAGRLNGPADNPMSSCLSCHATASFPQRSPMAPPMERWFRNIKAGAPFDLDTASLDYSLQLAQSVLNFCGRKDLPKEAQVYCARAETGEEPSALPVGYNRKEGLPISRDEDAQNEEVLARQRVGGVISRKFLIVACVLSFVLGMAMGGGTAAKYKHMKRRA